MEFKIQLEGLDILSQQWDGKRISKQLSQGIARTSNILTSEIRQSVVRRYSVSSTEVDKTLIGKSSSLQKRGKNILRSGITYKYKAKPLNEFPHKEFTISVKSRFLIPRAKGFAMIKKRTTKGVKVTVIRGQSKVVTGNYGFGGFLQKRGTSKWAAIQGGRVSKFPTGIYERKQDATWIKEPEERAPIRRAYGPSVTQMIEHQLNNDSRLRHLTDNFDLLLADNLTF